MRVEKDYAVFVNHPEWYTFVPGIGFIPTEQAPDYAVEAMKRWNETH